MDRYAAFQANGEQVVVEAIDQAEQSANVSEEDYSIIKRMGQALSACGESFVLHKSVNDRIPNISRYRAPLTPIG